MKGKIVYKVRLIKEFLYPKAMLSRGMEEVDATHKAHNDIHRILDEIVNNKYEDVDSYNLFTTEIVEDKGWKLRNEDKSINKVNIEDIISHFALIDIEKKYGILNIEENPDLFEYVETRNSPYMATSGNIEYREIENQWVLKNSIENEFIKIKNLYKNKLRKFYNEEPTTSRPRTRELPRRNIVNTDRSIPEPLVLETTIRHTGVTWATLTSENINAINSNIDNLRSPRITVQTGVVEDVIGRGDNDPLREFRARTIPNSSTERPIARTRNFVGREEPDEDLF